MHRLERRIRTGALSAIRRLVGARKGGPDEGKFVGRERKRRRRGFLPKPRRRDGIEAAQAVAASAVSAGAGVRMR